MQGELVNIQKKNVIEDLESGNIKYVLVEDFLADLKIKFRRELVEQGRRIMEEFVQEFKKAVRGSSFEERVLVKEFKQEMDKTIRRKLMEVEQFPWTIKQ